MAGYGRLWIWWTGRARVLRRAAELEAAEHQAAVRRILRSSAGQP